MKFKSIKVRGLGPFKKQVEHDLSTLEGRLTVISGANGAGKSTLAELLLGAVYRSTPTRGTLVNLAGENRDGLLEVTVETDDVYILRHLVDGVSGKAEAVAMYGDGKPITNTGKVTEFDSWVSKHFPTIDLALVTQFAAQQSGGFLDCKPANRKTLMLQMFGADHIEELAKYSRDRERTHQRAVEQLSYVHSAPRPPGIPVADTQALRVVEAHERAKRSHQLALSAQSALEDARLAHQAAGVQERDLQEWQGNHSRIAAALFTLGEEDGVLFQRATADDELLTNESAVNEAVKAQEEIRGRGQELGDAAGIRKAQVEALVTETRVRRESIAGLDVRLKRAANLSAEYSEVANAAELAESLKADIEKLDLVAAAAEHSLEAVRAERLMGAEERIEALRNALIDVESSELTANEVARYALDADDKVVKAAASLPKLLKEAQTEVARIHTERHTARTSMGAAQTKAGRLSLVEAARTEASGLEGERSALAEADSAAAGILAAAQADHQEAETRLKSTRAEYVQAAQLASMAPSIAAAKGRAEGRAEQLEQNTARKRVLEAEREALGERPQAPIPIDLEAFKRVEERESRAFTAAEAAHAAEISLHERALEHDAGLVETKAQLDKCIEVHDDWARLGRDLGKDGLQAALIDAALPELVSLTNQLLGDAFGPRFAVDVRSQNLSVSGKKMIETLDVFVLDGERGREAKAETYSGGERAIIAEGLSLALTTLACRQAGIDAPTIIRDEAGAALDEGRGRQWVAMLRQAAELIGAERVLFVSHDAGCRALADSEVAL